MLLSHLAPCAFTISFKFHGNSALELSNGTVGVHDAMVTWKTGAWPDNKKRKVMTEPEVAASDSLLHLSAAISQLI